jgi:non-lysosomal glucosylceramidase
MQARNGIRTFSPAASAVAFPLGGIGTGNVSLGARGDLRDWEIYNHADKGTTLPNTFFAIRTQTKSQGQVTKVLEAPLQAPHTLSNGYHPTTAAGLPRLSGATFRGEYPFATIEFEDADLPVQVQLEAFTPLIPLNPDESGIPCAILKYVVTNTSNEPVSLTIVGSLTNPVGGVSFSRFGHLESKIGQNVNEFRDEAVMRGLFMRSEQLGPEDLLYGDVSLVTTHPSVTVKRTWLREWWLPGAWFDFLREFWDDLSDDGLLKNLDYDSPSDPGRTDTGSLGLVDTLQPGETKPYRFILTWFFPNRVNSWRQYESAPLTRNHYAIRFDSSWEVARHVVQRFPHLEDETRRFHGALFGTTLPPYVLDAISANIVPLRSNTCFWLEDGRFLGWEGCFDDRGCCEGSCTHVWSYAQTLAFLFPSLEREMRRIEFVVETEDNGYMPFRTAKTFGELSVWPGSNQEPEPAADGQMGSILRVYREWLLGGDIEWLETVWPGVKRAILYGSARWDTDGDGVLDGRQHNTYDTEFYGPNPLCSIYYLAGLRAVEELAHVMDEPELARRCHEMFVRGSQRLDAMLWNGEYYIQLLDDTIAHKHQHGTGCLADQLLGQLYARILDLGELLPVEHARTATKSVFVHNFKPDFRNHVNTQRTFVLNNEAGLVLCTWPHGGRPEFPFPYSEEVWTGVEYQVAAQLIYEGWLGEGLTIVEAVRARHDGVRRNPWDEVECGHHYVRSMSSWALILALSGFHYNASAHSIAFAPVLNPENFSCFFSTGSGWGIFSQQSRGDALNAWLELRYGNLSLHRLTLGPTTAPSSVGVTLNGNILPARLEYSSNHPSIVFDQEVVLNEDQTLSVSLD